MKKNNYRDKLGFQSAVHKYFAFLESEHGYKCVSSDLYTVKYYSENAYLNIYHDRISYEISIRVGILPENYNNSFKAEILDIIRMANVRNEKGFYQASNKSAVYIVVEKLANLVNMYAKEALIANTKYFNAIISLRAQLEKKELLLQQIKIADEKAKIAWENKDYKMITEIYNNYIDYLNPVQLKRFKYAKKMISD